MDNSAQVPLPSKNSEDSPKEVNKFIDINITPDKVYAIAIMTLILVVFGGFIFVASSNPTKDNGGISANGSPQPEGLGIAKVGGIGNQDVKGAATNQKLPPAGPQAPKKTPKPSASPTSSPTTSPSPTNSPSPSPTPDNSNNNNSNPTSTPYPAFSASCSTSPASTAAIGENVNWTALATGGTGNFSYEWSGDASGSDKTVTKSYDSAGTKNSSVKVKDTTSNNEVTTSCQITINQPS